MACHLLILGGTTEGMALSQLVHAAGLRGIYSLAGRVAMPKPQPLVQRVGGFGGVAGLQAYLQEQAITHVVDATHPFAARMSTNAAQACAALGLPLIALTRAPWQSVEGDDWIRVRDMSGAVRCLEGPAKRVFLAVGRMHLAEFAAQPQHHYLLRLVDRPQTRLPLPDCTVVVARGPFTLAGDLALLRDNSIDLVVSKNSGGSGAQAKITAARQLGLPVLMIDRPRLPDRPETHSAEEVLAWLHHSGADLGV